MKKNIFCLLLAITLLLTTNIFATAEDFYPHFSEDYTDESHKGMRSFSMALGEGITKGGVHNEFKDTYILGPFDPITPEAFLSLIGRGAGYKPGMILPHASLPMKNPKSYWTYGEVTFATSAYLTIGFWDYLRSDGRSYNNNWNYDFTNTEAENMTINYRKEATFELAVGLLITMIGYESAAKQNGGWPYGYIKTAESLGLFENTDCNAYTDPKAAVTRLDSLVMVHNALNTPLYLTPEIESAGYISDFRALSESFGKVGGALYNGMGASGKYETINTFQNKIYPVNGQLISWHGSYGEFRIEYADNYAGQAIGKFDNATKTVIVETDFPYQDFNANAFLNRPCEALLHVDPYGSVKLRHIGAGQQLAMPIPYVANAVLHRGESPVISWNAVPHADYYTVWDWTRNKAYEVYDIADVTTFSGIAPYTEPGTYAIGVYARSWGDPSYRQSKGYSFNITVANEWAPEKVDATLNGAPLSFDVPPQIINGRTMVPVRAIFEALGADVSWNEATQTVIGKNDKYEVNIQIGSNTMYWAVIYDGYSTQVPLDSPAVIIDGRTLIPARAVAEAFGCKVDWDETTRTVLITS